MDHGLAPENAVFENWFEYALIHSLEVLTLVWTTASLHRTRFLYFGSSTPLSPQSGGTDIRLDHGLAPQNAVSAICFRYAPLHSLEVLTLV